MHADYHTKKQGKNTQKTESQQRDCFFAGFCAVFARIWRHLHLGSRQNQRGTPQRRVQPKQDAANDVDLLVVVECGTMRNQAPDVFS